MNEKKFELKRNIFEPRLEIKPYEYPELLEFKDAIRHSYWLHTEFNFTSDIQDFKTVINSSEREIITRTMLAISQIEVDVKRFWGNIDKYFPKPEVNDVGGTFAECHIEGTQALTLQGWKDLKDIEIGEMVLQYNPDKTLNFTPVIAKTIKPFKGNMYKMSKQGLECVVTPNHRFVYFSRAGNLLEKTAEEFNPSVDAKIPFCGYLKGKVNSLTAEERLWIAIQADGSARYYRKNGERIRRGLSTNNWIYEISVKKPRKVERLKWLLEQCDYEYNIIPNKRQYFKVEIKMPQIDFKNFDWVDLSDKSHLWCKEFIDELVLWDGYYLAYKKDAKRKYSTTNKSCADVAQAIGMLAGYRPTMIHSVDNRKESYKDCYVVSYVENRLAVGSNNKLETIPYEGNVYCLTVESGILPTRYKDSVIITGNSEIRHKDAYSFLLEKLGLNDLFKNVKNTPALMARIEYMQKFMKNKDDGKEEFTLSLILFSLFIEHISLFSQFLIMMSFNKHRNLFKGISNAVEATSKEEEIHGKFGIALYEILRKEHPEIFVKEKDFFGKLKEMANEAFKAEEGIVDWIFESGELDFLPKEVVMNYIKSRYNNSLEILGIEKPFEIDEKMLEQTKWFDDEILATKETDFFNKRSTDYSKKMEPITPADLF